MKNWWYYHKWYVICGIILLGIICNVVGNALGLWHKAPDFQIAYVGKTQLPQDTVSALEESFAAAGEDFNGDGEVIVRVNQYISGNQSQDAEIAYYEYASELTLVGDISDCESYFFLMDDPDDFQRNYQLLASSDGSCPDEMDHSIEDKVILWADCPALSGMELGSYSTVISGEEVTGDNQELLAPLYFGRRCFYTKDRVTSPEKCNKLWNDLWIQ
ncbi:hypothetical protein E5329_07040 [Petralouisia muris]|jgi:hypothetical protein|uniref:Uncharacterized protein n=1 Tax=Petralouisia muris TaxID=3032872 RepID=A0AC61RZA1_9FIRM|nr:hypothetical protein [Petralouisia muris]TGY96971.1 hypothetical protein E5329_07040 [Petralouisia muris]